MRRKAEDINEAKERLLREDERKDMIRIEWWRERRDVWFFLYTRNAINLSEARAEATRKDSVKLWEERLQLFGHDAALNVYYTLSGYTLRSNKGDKAEDSIAKLCRLGALITTEVASMTDRERPEGHR